jgi:hypothetical protein
MTETKLTAVELIFDELHDKGLWSSKMEKIFEQAKEMEKQQIEDANIYGWRQALDESVYSLDTEQYYNETFKNK